MRFQFHGWFENATDCLISIFPEAQQTPPHAMGELLCTVYVLYRTRQTTEHARGYAVIAWKPGNHCPGEGSQAVGPVYTVNQAN